MSFPKNFVWGASAASYQIEGAAFEDGKGLSVWDMMCRWQGKIFQGQTGNTSCDHYHHYLEDVKLMGEIGLKGYRLSISWPRVLPEGIGGVNHKGLAFYDQLVDALLENGIAPWVTLFHWDFPYALFCRGGWLNRDSADWFAEYTAVIVDKLSDRVAHWMTQNEPQCFIGLGHYDGCHAPGIQLDFPEILQATHHALLAHGKAVQTIRAHAKTVPLIGAAPVGIVAIPVSDSTDDIGAARQNMFSITKKHYWNNTWYADPMIFGNYPHDGLKLFEKDLPQIKAGDMETICQPLDFYGANIYHAETVQADNKNGYQIIPQPDGYPITTMDWPVTPEALYWGPKFFYERYQLPIAITENGVANMDWIHLDGKVHDPQRIDFLTRYLRALRRAVEYGVPVLGYFLWSIMDNFEWSHGYKRRFGLIYVDYQTKKRILKDSAHWYRNVIVSNGGNL
ncbi:MAG TPA: beta-glucosidase [bacterium]|nr:beta-glucosidase [bacterium]